MIKCEAWRSKRAEWRRDTAGLTENMVIPDTYSNVYVKTVPGVTIKRTTKGFMIIVK